MPQQTYTWLVYTWTTDARACKDEEDAEDVASKVVVDLAFPLKTCIDKIWAASSGTHKARSTLFISSEGETRVSFGIPDIIISLESAYWDPAITDLRLATS